MVHIVTDGSLDRVSFASLRPRGRPLVRDYAISYVPSINALYAADARTPVAYDGDTVWRTPYDDCVMVMPGAAHLKPGNTAVRLGRYVDY